MLPDYQGVGIGRKLLTWAAELYKKRDAAPFIIVTSNPQIIRSGMLGWRITRAGRGGKINNKEFLKQMHGAYRHGAENRLTVSLEYVGVTKMS